MQDLNNLMFPFDKNKRESKSNILILQTLQQLIKRVEELEEKVANLESPKLISTLDLDSIKEKEE